MQSVSQYLWQQKNLAKLQPEKMIVSGDDISFPSTARETPKEERIDQLELELAYMKVPGIFNGINKMVQNIMSAKYSIVAKDKEVKKFFEDFIENVGSHGAELSWEELLERLFQDQAIYGYAFIEKLFNEKTKEILDLDLIDSKRIDYAKDSAGNIVTDANGIAVGYTQKLTQFEEGKVKSKFTVPKEVSLGNAYLYIPNYRLSMFKLCTVGDSYYPLGLIEPAYRQIVRKMNLEEAYSNANYRHVYPVIHAKIGDINHQPTPETINKILDKLKDMDFKKEIATPYYYDLQLLQAREPAALSSSLGYFEDEYVAAMGAPKPFVTGAGEATNRSTLVIQNRMWQLALREIIEKTCSMMRRSVFKPICEQQGFSEVPKIVWGDVGLEEKDEKAKRILEYVKGGIMTVEEAKPRIFQLEGF